MLTESCSVSGSSWRVVTCTATTTTTNSRTTAGGRSHLRQQPVVSRVLVVLREVEGYTDEVGCHVGGRFITSSLL